MQEEFSIGLLLGKLYRKRGLITVVTLLFIVGSVVTALLLPRKYMAVASLLPQEESSGSSLGALLSQTGMALPLSLLGGGGGTGHIDREIVSSVTVRMKVVDDLDLYDLFGLTEARQEDPEAARDAAVALLGEQTTIEYDDMTQVLRLAVVCPDSRRCVDIVDKYLYELERFNRTALQTSGRSKREFLEGRLAVVNNDLERAEKAVRDFSARNGTIHIPTELEGELALVAEINSRLVARELERAAAAQDAAPDAPVVRRLDAAIEVLRDKLAKLETEGDSDMRLHALADLPALTLEYYKHQKELRIQQEIAALLRQQIEQAKLQEHNDIPTLKILDAPRVPTLPVWPRKKLIVIAATLLGFILASLLALVLDFRESVAANENGKLDAWQWLPGFKRRPQA